MEFLKMLSASEIFAQAAGFILLFLLLKAFFWKKFLNLLDQRAAKISGALKNIEDAKTEVARIKTDYELKVAEIESYAQGRIREAVVEGQKKNEELHKKALEQSQDIIENAKESVKYELSKVRQELKDEIVDISLKAAETVIREKLTEEDDRKIVEDFIKEIEGTK
ncbi:MAG: F0F1 ATP synthase subunit B [Candidatus Omnitrophica bacterium]|jgi:F-type H+-transporting ATPase subunit b|nr:F0F1 ATP synthase subunit B [Candidatus Omnitrophota bacterium]